MAMPAVGDHIEIKYRTRPFFDDAVRDRWVDAVVVLTDADTWPLVRLKDGQLTEVRPYMTWRRSGACAFTNGRW